MGIRLLLTCMFFRTKTSLSFKSKISLAFSDLCCWTFPLEKIGKHPPEASNTGVRSASCHIKEILVKLITTDFHKVSGNRLATTVIITNNNNQQQLMIRLILLSSLYHFIKLIAQNQKSNLSLHAKTTMMSSTDQQIIVELNENDVVCGGRRSCRHHPGNQYFHKLIKHYVAEYSTVSRSDKSHIISKIISLVNTRQSKNDNAYGIFVRKQPSTGMFISVDDSYVVS